MHRIGFLEPIDHTRQPSISAFLHSLPREQTSAAKGRFAPAMDMGLPLAMAQTFSKR